MLRTRGGRGLSQLLLLRRAVASAASAPQPLQAHVTNAAASRFNAAALADRQNVPWLQQLAGMMSIAGDGADSHDDFKPVQKDGSALPSVHEHIEKDVKENPVLVYMKGVPEAPQCGFSAMVVRILDDYGVQYQTRNVLTDPELRTAVKEYRTDRGAREIIEGCEEAELMMSVSVSCIVHGVYGNTRQHNTL